jgi:hypothetical protein
MTWAQRVLAASVLALAALTCNGGHEMPPPTGGSGSMSPWNELKVPGMELFLQRDAGTAHDAVPLHGAARITGSRDVLTGKAAFDAARSRTGDDPTTLAALAMMFLDQQVAGVTGHLPWTATTNKFAADQEALAAPPRLTGTTLEYWRAHAMTADLVHCRAELATGAVNCEIATEAVHAQQLAGDPYKVIEQELASNDVNSWNRAASDLVKIGDDRARKRLIDVALDGYWPQQRQAAVEALGHLPGPGVVDALQRIQDHDKSPDVSAAAYRVLAQLKSQPPSRP